MLSGKWTNHCMIEGSLTKSSPHFSTPNTTYPHSLSPTSCLSLAPPPCLSLVPCFSLAPPPCLSLAPCFSLAPPPCLSLVPCFSLAPSPCLSLVPSHSAPPLAKILAHPYNILVQFQNSIMTVLICMQELNPIMVPSKLPAGCVGSWWTKASGNCTVHAKPTLAATGLHHALLLQTSLLEWIQFDLCWQTLQHGKALFPFVHIRSGSGCVKIMTPSILCCAVSTCPCMCTCSGTITDQLLHVSICP